LIEKEEIKGNHSLKSAHEAESLSIKDVGKKAKIEDSLKRGREDEHEPLSSERKVKIEDLLKSLD
jgi:hypothetical protein